MALHSFKKLKESALFIDAIALIFSNVPKYIFRKFYPYSVNIEMTNMCMAKCTLCTVNCATKRKKGIMKYEDFVKIIDMLPKTTKEVYLNYAGEPLINKEVFICIRYATKKGLYVYLSSNGELLDKFSPEEVCKSGLNDFAICIDGPNADAHEFYRKNTHFDRICKAAKKLNEYKERYGLKKPNTIFQTLINKHTYRYIKETKELAKKLKFDEINYRTTYIPGIINRRFHEVCFPNYDKYEEGKKYFLFEKDNKYNPYIQGKKGKYKYKNARRFCSFFNPMIFWNGDLGICCCDPDGSLVYGNVLKESFEKIYKKLPRRKICFGKFDICKTCFRTCYFNIGVERLK